MKNRTKGTEQGNETKEQRGRRQNVSQICRKLSMNYGILKNDYKLFWNKIL